MSLSVHDYPGPAPETSTEFGASVALEAEGLALEARLDEFSLDLLLGLVANSRRSGVLEITGPRPAALYFVDGELCGGESLEDPSLRAALGRARAGAHRQEIRHVVQDHLVTALAAALVPSLVPSEANAQFRAGPADPELSLYRFRLPAMLGAARERMEAWRVIADVIPSTELVLGQARDLPPTLDQVLIERDDWQILSSVNGSRNVAEIVELSGRTAFEACSSLYRMIVLGVIAIP